MPAGVPPLTLIPNLFYPDVEVNSNRLYITICACKGVEVSLTIEI